MSKGFKIVLSIIGIIVSAFIVLAVVASNSSSHDSAPAEAASTDATEVGSTEKAKLVTIIQQYAAKHFPGTTIPDILDRSAWTFEYDPDADLYYVKVNSTNSSGYNVISAYISLSGDSDYDIHYLDSGQGGVAINDGTVDL